MLFTVMPVRKKDRVIPGDKGWYDDRVSVPGLDYQKHDRETDLCNEGKETSAWTAGYIFRHVGPEVLCARSLAIST